VGVTASLVAVIMAVSGPADVVVMLAGSAADLVVAVSEVMLRDVVAALGVASAAPSMDWSLVLEHLRESSGVASIAILQKSAAEGAETSLDAISWVTI
jgi:hypothetical protein